ncbi:GntR family transcriptional regulator [Bacterioplanes sanyensis]|uniref:GntR family transcriptional regulator n=1 Tax=Bacterioplanes sanyensis TaxID=1249553 RepID=A0A222FN36_9GAMM|nr:GntR family transcriptional regulator [Bacterioplanes sanyensis]ASP39633.1 GntR family transcriptional regulator [Bacterioplanes sanyensis]
MSLTHAQSLAEHIADHIEQRILNGDMVSGERIQEIKVVNALEVSRGSVREALLLLESRHLVTILPRRGAFVAELNAERVHSLYDLFEHLLVMLTTQLAQRWQDNQLEPLLATAQSLAQHEQTDDYESFMAQGFVLMRDAMALVGNDYLSHVLSDLQPAIRRTYALAMRHSQNERQHAQQFFAQLLQAVMQRDVAAMAPIVHNYGQHQRDKVLEALAQGHEAAR